MSERGWADVIRGLEPAPSGACLGEGQVIAFYSGDLAAEEEEAVREHLAECRPCREVARDARHFLQLLTHDDVSLQAVPRDGPTVARGHPPHRRAWWAAVAAAVLAGGYLWGPRPRPGAPEATAPTAASAMPSPTPARPDPRDFWRGLHVAQAPYTPLEATSDEVLWREGGASVEGGRPSDAPADAKDTFGPAMEAYQSRNFAEAEARLARLLSRDPRHAEGHFYRGVCLLLLGRPRDATASLERASELARGRRRDEAVWYLAMAHLRAGEPARALGPLDQVARGSSPHRHEAQRLRQEVAAVVGDAMGGGGTGFAPQNGSPMRTKEAQ